MGLKILHSADWHLDSPFAGFTGEQRKFLKRELLKIPGKVAELCRRENCGLVLLAGDLFDGPYTRESADVLKAALADCRVPVFISPGNHDFCGPGSPWTEEVWPENVHVFAGEMESVVIPELDCRVYGAGYRSMDCPGLLEGFRAEGEERYALAVLHGDPVQLKSPYCPITASQVRDSGLDYLALGHIHRAGSFRSGDTLCGWPGAPMGRGFDETGEKGIYILELGEERKLRRVFLDGPCFYDLTVDVGKEEPEDMLPAAGNWDFYRVTLVGHGEVDASELMEKFPNLELRDHRESELDIWAGADGDTLEGTYFRMLRSALETADEETGRLIQLAAEISRKILDGREVAL